MQQFKFYFLSETVLVFIRQCRVECEITGLIPSVVKCVLHSNRLERLPYKRDRDKLLREVQEQEHLCPAGRMLYLPPGPPCKRN